MTDRYTTPREKAERQPVTIIGMTDHLRRSTHWVFAPTHRSRVRLRRNEPRRRIGACRDVCRFGADPAPDDPRTPALGQHRLVAGAGTGTTGPNPTSPHPHRPRRAGQRRIDHQYRPSRRIQRSGDQETAGLAATHAFVVERFQHAINGNSHLRV